MPLTRFLPLAVAIAYTAIILAITPSHIGAFFELVGVYVRTMFALWVFVGLIILLVSAASTHQGRAPHAIVASFVRSRWREDRLVSAFTPPLVASLLLGSYNVFKQFVMPSAGFGAGPVIVALEHGLLGADPWQFTHALFSSPYATKLLDLAYHAWFLPMTLGVVACSYLRPGSQLTQRYLFCYALLWIVQGTLIAYHFPAAGPCSYGNFQADAGHFVELMRRLAQQDASLRASGFGGLAALEYQSILLRSFASNQPMLGNGISAMPSLHNAMAALFACAAMRINRRLGWCCVGYAAVIWIGSIHLGWHYALDGIVAIPLTIASWTASKWLWPDPNPNPVTRSAPRQGALAPV